MQLNAANEKLKELSLRDPLTNLHNRRYAFEFANDKIAQFIKNKTPLMNNNEKRQLSVQGTVVGVILIDIDHFKQVNDVYGHSAGDTVLVTISNILKGMIRSEDLLVRWGGEEFLIILYNTKPDYLRIFSKKVLEKIRETPIKISENQVIYKTCSLGYSEMPLLLNNPGLFNLEHMINLSDYAMYRAKENGRNCAAQFKLVQQEGKGEEIKNYLVNLSKCDKVNEEYFNIEFI
nr:GGDEF domain-containing protein [Acetivibrio clariflavus]